MRINFFEECLGDPTKDLAPAALIDFPSTIYIAAHSLNEFHERTALLRSINPRLEAAYWPILPKSYWISAFSYPHELEALYKELSTYEGAPLTVLLDLELPTLHPELYYKNLFSFFSNKKRVQKILALQKKELRFATAEYLLTGFDAVKHFYGIAYSTKHFRHTPILMYYTSTIHKRNQTRMRNALQRAVKRNPQIEVGLGTLTIGILGNEPTLSPENLEQDLAFVKSLGVQTVTIFRLGGLNEQYIEVLQKFK